MAAAQASPVRALHLQRVSHYHQLPGVHPHGVVTLRGFACVELMTGGRGWVQHEGEWIEVLPGDLLWHHPGDSTIGRSDFENPYRCLAIRYGVSPDRWRGIPRFSRWSELDEVKRFTQEAVALYVNEQFAKEDLAEYLLARLAFQARLHHFQQRNELLPAQLQRVLRRIESDYAQPLNLKTLADEAGWSEPHLHAVFRQHMHKTPHQVLMERRIRAAKERLSSSAAPIKQIAVECGYADAAAFCAVFRRLAGRTPATYRREQQLWLGAPGKA